MTGTGSTWVEWNYMTTTSATCVSNDSTAVWGSWNYATTDVTMTTKVWRVWAEPETYCITISDVAVPSPEVAEQYAAEQRRRQAEYEARMLEEKAKREAAEAKAEQLLVALLTLSQRLEWEKDRAFTVIGKKSRKKYRIERGTAGNVKELDATGKPIASLCCLPYGVADRDVNIAQKLMLEQCEDEFLQKANRRTA